MSEGFPQRERERGRAIVKEIEHGREKERDMNE